MKKILFLIILLIPELLLGQEETWNNYLGQFENGTGSVVLNMDIVKRAPIKALPFIIISGVKFKPCDKNGLPEDEGFAKLYQISDSINKAIENITETEFVGTFTYQCERLDYIYVKDTSGLRNEVSATYKRLFPEYDSYINIRYDKEWAAYLEFLYPNEQTMEYMSNQSVLDKLIAEGDNLIQARQVDHWLYFSNKKDLNDFAEYAKGQSFKIEGTDKVKGQELPYQLQISRTDKVDIESISKVTIQLRTDSKRFNGEYDGWETFIVK